MAMGPALRCRAAIEVKLSAAHKANEVSRRLATIPGVGPVTALTLAIEIDPAAFESGRHLAAWADWRGFCLWQHTHEQRRYNRRCCAA
jgi:transposase